MLIRRCFELLDDTIIMIIVFVKVHCINILCLLSACYPACVFSNDICTWPKINIKFCSPFKKFSFKINLLKSAKSTCTCRYKLKEGLFKKPFYLVKAVVAGPAGRRAPDHFLGRVCFPQCPFFLVSAHFTFYP